MIIETERLILRRFTPDDAEAYFPLVGDATLNRYTGQDLVHSVEEAREILLNYPIRDYGLYGYGRMAVIEKQSGKLIGFSGMKYLTELNDTDIGYRFLPEAWGKGYATESATVLMQQVIAEFKLPRVIGMADRKNGGSIKVLQKLGLAFEREIEVEGYDGMLDLYAWVAG